MPGGWAVAIGRACVLAVASLLIVTGAAANVPPRHADEAMAAWRMEGIASWYGPGFAGRRTACGPRFDPFAFTAAMRVFPCGTRLLVTNPANGREVIVTVQDRGPFVRGRLIDLSQGVARQLGLERAGRGRVLVEVLP